MRYFVYTRKSTESEDKQVLSIESQKEEIKSKFAHLEIVEVLSESFSAKSPGRPIFNQMIDRIKVGEADGIISWHPDRLARNSVDGGMIIYLLDLNIIKDLKFASYTFENTAEGKWMLNIIFGQSKYYVDKLSIDIKRGNRRKAELGQPPRASITGYKNILKQGNVKTWVVDGEKREKCLEVLKMAKNSDISLKELVRFSKSVGLKTRNNTNFVISTMDRWLRNPGLYGYFLQLGTLYKGDFEPLISEDFWNEIQYARGYKAKPRVNKNSDFLFPGLVTCRECGSKIVTYEKTKYYKGTNRTATYRYCRCGNKKKDMSCKQPETSEKELIMQVKEILKNIEINQEIWELSKKLLREKHKQEMKKQDDSLRATQRGFAKVKQQLGGLLDMKIKGLLEDDEYLEKKKELKEREEFLDKKIRNNVHDIDRWLELAEKVFDTAFQAQKVFDAGDFRVQREILKEIGLNLYYDNKKLYFELKKPYDILSKRLNNSNWWSIVEEVWNFQMKNA